MQQNTTIYTQQYRHARTHFSYTVNVFPHGSIQMRGLINEGEFASLKTVIEWNMQVLKQAT